MWNNSDVADLIQLLREIRDELKRLNDNQCRIDIEVPQELLDVRKKEIGKSRMG